MQKLFNGLCLIVLGGALSVAYGLKTDLVEIQPGRHKTTVIAGDDNARQWLKEMAEGK